MTNEEIELIDPHFDMEKLNYEQQGLQHSDTAFNQSICKNVFSSPTIQVLAKRLGVETVWQAFSVYDCTVLAA